MKINNYYNLPVVPCKLREGLISSNQDVRLRDRRIICENINPDEVYNTLYPNGQPSTTFESPESDYLEKLLCKI